MDVMLEQVVGRSMTADRATGGLVRRIEPRLVAQEGLNALPCASERLRNLILRAREAVGLRPRP